MFLHFYLSLYLPCICNSFNYTVLFKKIRRINGRKVLTRIHLKFRCLCWCVTEVVYHLSLACDTVNSQTILCLDNTLVYSLTTSLDNVLHLQLLKNVYHESFFDNLNDTSSITTQSKMQKWLISKIYKSWRLTQTFWYTVV